MEYQHQAEAVQRETGTRVERFMVAVYAWMTLGLSVTAATSFYVASTSLGALLSENLWLYLGLAFVEVALVGFLTARAKTLSSWAARTIFIVYAALTGVTLSIVILATPRAAMTTAFVTVASTFLAMTVFGLCTRRSLSGWATFLYMGLMGVVTASLVNLGLGSHPLGWVTSLAAIVVFTGLTAYDTQKLRMAAEADDAGILPIQGALILYLDFLNLLVAVLNVLSSEE